VEVPGPQGPHDRGDGAELAPLQQRLLDGLGIAFFPRFFVEGEIASGRLVELLADYPGPELSLNAVYETRRHLLPKVAAFLGFLKEWFGPRA
jgi:DNA-binding transcriptional LysR family regulator